MKESKGVAVVTGASSGIGAVYAERLAARGKDLVLVARRRDRLENIAASLSRTYGTKVKSVEADLGDSSGLARVATLLREREEIDFLVNNAGLWAPGVSVSADPNAVEQLVKVNILALTSLSLAVVPRFKKNDRGTIVNIGSLIAFKSSPTAAAYCASKAFTLNFTRSMQVEFADTGVKIQLVIPGFVHTEFFGGSVPSLPEHLFSTAEAVVDCALHGLDNGELVCIPTLADLSLWTKFEEARQGITNATQTGRPAPRYDVAPA
jgi:short-subunit dehydrogenase